MNDQAKYTVTLEFQTSGADKELNNLREWQRGIDDVARHGGMADKTQNRLSRTVEGLSGNFANGAKNANGYSDSIVSLRYANYDLASTLLATSAAITAVGAASVIAFAQQEAAFTTVERIASGSYTEVQNLREELQRMSTEIPVAFGELSNIASLGAALDIPADQLDEFTNAVAKFAATTGVTVEAAATGFGRLAAYLQIPKEEFENLGSAILRAGNISVATEEQVLKFAQALALPGARIGFTTDQVVALGATLASFGNINVEGAGSALNRVTKNIERALADSGEDLQTWAATAGMSAESFRVAWGSDVSGTFNRVIEGLSKDVGGLVGNLDALGIRNVRDQRIIEALALNYEKYNQILGQTNQAWREGTYMNEAYGLVLDDLVSKWQIFVNSLTNFAAAVGSQLAPALAIILDVATKLLVTLSDFASSPFGGFVVQTVAALAGMAAAWAAVRGTIALATASMLALNFATRNIGGAGIIAGLGALRSALFGVQAGATGAAVGVTTLSASFRRLLVMTGIGAVMAYVAQWIFAPGEAAQWTGEMMIWLAETAVTVAHALGQIFGTAAANSLTISTYVVTQGLRDMGAEMLKIAKNAPKQADSVSDFNAIMEEMGSIFDDAASGAGDTARGIGDVGSAAGAAAKQVRTLVDYSNDLSSVWGRAFDIRFGGLQALDQIRGSFISIREAADEAAKRIRDLKNDIQGLSSDIDIQEYFLSIAVEYGDTKRAAAIEADLAKKRAELADRTADLQKEQDSASKTLTGTTKGAIENRQEILNLVTQYRSYLQALAASGVSQGALATASEQLRRDFVNQATALGFNREELRQFEMTFSDISRTISAVPFAVTTDLSSLDPALLAIREFVDQANSSLNTLGSGVPGAIGGALDRAVDENQGNAEQTGTDLALTASEFWQKYAVRGVPEGTSAALKATETSSRPAAITAGSSIGDIFSGRFGSALTSSGGLGYQASAGLSSAQSAATPSAQSFAAAMAVILKNGLSLSLDTLLGGRYSTARSTVRNLIGFADGGYTGAGGRNEPAGIVHRGEYVIPKSGVNQATGMPYADALGRLMSGIRGYASGGPTTGSGGSSGVATVALTAGTIQAIAHATGKAIYLDGKLIADSSANVYSEETTVGAY